MSKNSASQKGVSKSIWIRIFVVWVVMITCMVGLIGGRLFFIMVIQGDEYQQKAVEQQLYDAEITAKRGDIYDKNMETLATSATVWTVYITPNDFKKITDDESRNSVKESIAKNLSEILSLEYEEVLENTNKTSSYVIVKRNVEKPEADKVREFISSSELNVGRYIGLDESSKRYYPNDNLASTVLGFVGTDNQGLAGLELQYDSTLTGAPGRVVAAKDALGIDMPFSYELMVDATAGNSLVTTVDTYVQYVCENYLAQAMIDNKTSERGCAVVMNVNTGEVLAMAVKGDFNPNDPLSLSDSDSEQVELLEGDDRKNLLSELRNKQWRNKIISDTYEPGSVFKIVTLSMALEENITSLSNHYSCSGSIVVAGQKYSCHKTSGHGAEILTQAVQNSCNPVFITLGQQLGASKFSKYFEAFGLTTKTGIDLPGETSSQYHKEINMGPTELASTSFGQTFNITPIQMITAISTAVNGGYLIQPHLVSSIIDNDGNVVEKVETTVKRQVISNETSSTVRQLMEAVVNGGGGKNAYVPGYSVGGKTGTAEKVSQNLVTGEKSYIASFVGVAPMDNPEIAVLVLLDEPNGSSYYGGQIAAPVGGQILSDILPYLGYEPSYSEDELKTLGIKVPNLIGNTLANAKSTLNTQNLTYKVIGSGEKIVKQLPESSASIYEGGVVVLYTEEDNEVLMTNVPDFAKLTVSGVSEIAAKNNIYIEYSGTSLNKSGVVSYRQSIEAGTSVEAGTVVTVYFRSNDTAD